jgi:hypothetical protein
MPCTRMGSVFSVGGATDDMAWGTLSSDKVLSMMLVWPNEFLRDLPNASAGPSIIDWMFFQLFWMGPGRHGYYVHNILEWGLAFSKGMLPIIWCGLHCPLRKHWVLHRLPICSIERAAKCVSQAKCSAMIVLTIVWNGPRQTLVSLAWYTRMGHAFCLGGAANTMAWATFPSDKKMSITLIQPNMLPRELPNASAGPGVTPWMHCWCYWMGQGRLWYQAHDTLEWTQHFDWEVLPILWHRPYNLLKKYCLLHWFTWMPPWESCWKYQLSQV